MTVPARFGVFGALATLAVVGSGCTDSAGTARNVDVDVDVDISLPELSLPVITVSEITVSEITVSEITVSEPPVSEPPGSEITVSPTTPGATTGSSLFVAPSGDYTIEFPDAPTRTDLPVDLSGETVVADAYLYEDGADAVYFTSVFDYPDAILGTPSGVVLEGARDGAVDTIGGVVDTSDFVERSGVPGIEFTFTIDTGVGTALVLFDEPRLYQSFALGVTDGAADYRRFVDTFQFTASSPPEADS